MRVVTIIQTKGGSGKTTLAMALASGAVSLGKRVHLLDGDRNPQLAEWQARVEQADWENVPKPDWPDNLTSSLVPGSLDELYSELNTLEGEGVELVIIDTRPGTHTDTEDLALASDVTLIPAVPSQMDYHLAQDAYVWMMKLKETIQPGDKVPEVRIVVSNASKEIVQAAMGISTDGVTRKEYDILAAIMEMPAVMSIVPHSKVWAHAAFYGPLSVAAKAHADTKGARIQANPMWSQVDIAENLVNEVMQVGGA